MSNSAPCCDFHDRMDRKLTSDQYLDFACGTPTQPDGEERFCCRACPSKGHPLALKAQYAGNPELVAFLSPAEQAEVLRLAVAAGPMVVDIVMDVPAPLPGLVGP